MDYSPWRQVGDLPDVEVARVGLGGANGAYVPSEQVILLERTLDAAGRRSVLAHELAHIDLEHHDARPCGPDSARQGRRRERAADDLAARRLIPIEMLAYALRWSVDERELADELWVNVATVRTRLAGLTDAEMDQIDGDLWGSE